MTDERDALVDQLAQEIRRVDGSHSLGAGALAEALMPFVAALAAPVGREGWKLVPVEPTDEMVWAGKGALAMAEHAMKHKKEHRSPMTETWNAMLAAAPEPPQ